MGQNLSSYSIDDRTTCLCKELDIDINKIHKCELMKLNAETYDYDIIPINSISVKNAINEMNKCYYISTNYIYNTKYRIKINFDNSETILALSDCLQYIGKPTRASGWGNWFYLKNNDIKFTPFRNLINN